MLGAMSCSESTKVCSSPAHPQFRQLSLRLKHQYNKENITIFSVAVSGWDCAGFKPLVQRLSMTARFIVDNGLACSRKERKFALELCYTSCLCSEFKHWIKDFSEEANGTINCFPHRSHITDGLTRLGWANAWLFLRYRVQGGLSATDSGPQEFHWELSKLFVIFTLSYQSEEVLLSCFM